MRRRKVNSLLHKFLVELRAIRCTEMEIRRLITEKDRWIIDTLNGIDRHLDTINRRIGNVTKSAKSDA